MISEVHAGNIGSATHATEKGVSPVIPDNKAQPSAIEQDKNSPSAVVSLGNKASSDLLTYSKQSILENAAAAKTDASMITEQAVALVEEPDVTTSAFGGTKKPPP